MLNWLKRLFTHKEQEMATVIFNNPPFVTFNDITEGVAFTKAPGGPTLYRKASPATAVNENAGTVELVQGDQQVFVIAESRITIEVAGA